MAIGVSLYYRLIYLFNTMGSLVLLRKRYKLKEGHIILIIKAYQPHATSIKMYYNYNYIIFA